MKSILIKSLQIVCPAQDDSLEACGSTPSRKGEDQKSNSLWVHMMEPTQGWSSLNQESTLKDVARQKSSCEEGILPSCFQLPHQVGR
jgi:hypothetical protein